MLQSALDIQGQQDQNHGVRASLRTGGLRREKNQWFVHDQTQGVFLYSIVKKKNQAGVGEAAGSGGTLVG